MVIVCIQVVRSITQPAANTDSFGLCSGLQRSGVWPERVLTIHDSLAFRRTHTVTVNQQ